MKRRPTLAGGRVWLAVLIVVLAPASSPGLAAPAEVSIPPSLAPETLGYQLLTNYGLEAYDAPYGQYEGADCQVASGWHRFWYEGPEPYWINCRVFADSPLGPWAAAG
ncbi:MAG: hypothetical protein P8129_23940 [Anaerolineae bacterium]